MQGTPRSIPRLSGSRADWSSSFQATAQHLRGLITLPAAARSASSFSIEWMNTSSSDGTMRSTAAGVLPSRSRRSRMRRLPSSGSAHDDVQAVAEDGGLENQSLVSRRSCASRKRGQATSSMARPAKTS